MFPNYTEEKFETMGLHRRLVEVVKTIIPDATTKEEMVCIRIQEIRKSGN